MDWSKFVEKALEISTFIVNNYGPKAWEVMLQLKQIEGAQNLVWGALLFLLAIAVLVSGHHIGKVLVKKAPYGHDDADYYFPLTISVILGFFISLSAWAFLFNVWNWIALFWPELAIAHDVMEKTLR